MSRVVLGVLAIFLNGSTALPTLVQPGIQFSDVDADKAPVQGATVHLVRYPISFVQYEQVETLTTDSSGTAVFSSDRKWDLFIEAPEAGDVDYNWGWCVESPGFTSVFRDDLRSSGYSEVQDVVLHPGESPSQCAWHCYSCSASAAPE